MKLLCFGLGYTAEHLIDHLGKDLEGIVGTSRTPEKRSLKTSGDSKIVQLESIQPRDLEQATHILISIPPADTGDIVAELFGELLKQCNNLQWLGYLSTTGVYGDHQGGWVDEDTPTSPSAERSKRRALAEQHWLGLHKQHHVPTHIFRLAGIYGPGRSVLDKIKTDKVSLTDKLGHVFSRIHVEDIAGILAASMKAPAPGEIYNVCDDHPCGSIETQEYAAKLLGTTLPPALPYAQAELSAMQKEFYADNRRVRNNKVKQALAYNLLYPSYKEGLTAIFSKER